MNTEDASCLDRELEQIEHEASVSMDDLDRLRTKANELRERLHKTEAALESVFEPEFVPATRETARVELNYLEGQGDKDGVNVCVSYIRLLDDHQKLVRAVKAWTDSHSDGYLRSDSLMMNMVRAARIKE